jgi:hypothetical protein
MSGRIKLLKGGVPVSDVDEPPLGYEYDPPADEFDEQCGTYALQEFQLPNQFCPERFVCDTESAGPSLREFSGCIDAMNCHMLSGMTTNVAARSEVALFIQQMIPHHQNAVNMAKALLKTNVLDCENLENEDSPDCILEIILREIINGQNFQIQGMRGVLEAGNFPETDNCDVRIITEDVTSGGMARWSVGGGIFVGWLALPWIASLVLV